MIGCVRESVCVCGTYILFLRSTEAFEDVRLGRVSRMDKIETKIYFYKMPVFRLIKYRVKILNGMDEQKNR